MRKSMELDGKEGDTPVRIEAAPYERFRRVGLFGIAALNGR